MPRLSRPLVAGLTIGLLATFAVGVLSGALLGRALNAPPSVPPVSVASTAPTVHPVVETPAPVVRPTAIATAEPIPSPPPTHTPTPTPTALPTSSPTPTPSPSPASSPTLDPATADEFALELAAALNDRDGTYLLSHLHPAVIARYGQTQCVDHIATLTGGASWQVQESSGPVGWDYVSDELTTTVPDAWSVTVRQLNGDPELRELHFAPADGTWRWFTDCGDPV
jgi:hypothetical protein